MGGGRSISAYREVQLPARADSVLSQFRADRQLSGSEGRHRGRHSRVVAYRLEIPDWSPRRPLGRITPFRSARPTAVDLGAPSASYPRLSRFSDPGPPCRDCGWPPTCGPSAGARSAPVAPVLAPAQRAPLRGGRCKANLRTAGFLIPAALDSPQHCLGSSAEGVGFRSCEDLASTGWAALLRGARFPSS